MALYLGVVTMALGNVLAVAGMRSMPPGPASTLLLADPLTATLLGILVLGETLPPGGLIGLLLVASGLVLQTRALGAPATDRPLSLPLHGRPRRRRRSGPACKLRRGCSP